MKVKASLMPLKELAGSCRTLFVTLKKIDPDFVWYLFGDDDDFTKAITTADEVPILQSALQKYLKDIRPGKGKYLDVWFEIKAGFNVDPESFLGDAHNILQVKMNGCLLNKDLPYAHTEETHMITNSYHGMNVKDHKNRIREII